MKKYLEHITIHYKKTGHSTRSYINLQSNVKDINQTRIFRTANLPLNHKSIFSREGIESLYPLYGQVLYIGIYSLNL